MSGPWEAYAEPAAAPAPPPGPWSAYQPAAIEPPEQIPEAMEQRLIAGDQARRREGGLLQTIPQGIDLISTPGGRAKLWEAVKAYPSKFVSDMFEMAKLPGDVKSGKVDLSTEEGLDQAIGLGMLVGMGRLNKLGTTGRTSGLSVTLGEKVARIERSPTGEIYDLPIGGAARSEDFASAAQVVGGKNAPFAVQEKLLRTYTEQGLHPAEVAHDAQTDPVIAQRLLSDDPRDLPGGPIVGARERPPIAEYVPADPLDLAMSGELTAAKAAEVSEGVNAYYKSTEDHVFGDRADEYRKLTRQSNRAWDNADDAKAKAIDAKREAIENEVGMTAADEDLMSGQGLPDHYSPDFWQGLKENLHEIELGRDEALATVAHQVRYLPKTRNWDKMKSSERESLLTIFSALNAETKAGRDPKAFLREAFQQRSARYGGGADAAELVEGQMKELRDLMSGAIEREPLQAAPRRAAPRELPPPKTETGQGGEPPRPPGEPPAEPPAPPPEGSPEAAQKKILDKISIGESAPQEKWTWAKFYRQAVDDLHPLKRIDADAYQLARLTRGQFGKAEHFLEHGTFDFETYKTNGKGLSDVLAPVRDDLDGLRAYLASKRAIEIEATERKSGLDLAAAREVIANGAAKYEPIAAELATYQANVLKYLKDSGVVSQAGFDAMREADKNYVPFHRVMGTTERAGDGAGRNINAENPVRRLRGSERDIVDPLESIIKNTYAFISAAERNAVGAKLIDALKKNGESVVTRPAETDAALAGYLKENGVANPEALTDFIKNAVPETGNDTITAYVKGVRKSVKVNDPELVRAMSGMDESSADMLTRVLAVPAKTLRAGSVLSPDFITRNVVRDFLTAFVNTGGAIFSPIDTAKGFKGLITKDADFLDWLKSGGANSTLVALDRRYMQESLEKLTADTGLGRRAWNVVTSPLSGLRLVSELAENATRLGEFKKLTGASKEEIQSAGYAAREVTLDFSRIGASMRAYNMITAFANAQLQGLDRIGRQFGDRPVNTTLKVAGGITLPSVLLWWANHDDPRYQELPHWQRDLFWIVMTKDHIYRIPKPFELGVVFGSGVERILDATIGKNPDAFDALGKSIVQVVTPNYIPTAIQPMFEQWANRSSFTDRTLIPKEMENFLPEYQYTPYTTELTKALGKIVSAIPGVRSEATGPGAPFGPMARAVTTPVLMENYIRSWTGGLGAYALQAADAGLRKAGVLPDPVKPADTLADIPFVRAFVVRYPSASAQSIQDFHDQFETSKKFYDTWMAKAKEGDADAMQRIQDAGGPMMFVRLDAINETLRDHSHLVRDVYKNPKIPADEKRQLIDGLYFNMMAIAKAGKQILREGEKAATVQ